MFLVLSGVGNVTIMDDENTTISDLGTQFLINEKSIGKNVKKKKNKFEIYFI